MAESELKLPAPLRHQIDPLLEQSRFKLWRWGRRSGKSRGSFIAATSGHGPGSTWGPRHDPLYPGILQGRDVIWVAPDYPQSLTIWQEEVRPRFAGLTGVELSEQKRQVRPRGLGMLEVRSAEAIDGLRGKGANVGGFILDESAHWDLEYAWRNVILPILMDNGGWAIFNSSPNAGLDGNALKETPSFFNRLCEQVTSGERGADWSHSHLTARDNPAISAVALTDLIAEYPANSPQLAQEVDAKLIVGGAGLAFPEFNTAFHTFREEIPPGWGWFGGLDWGYTSPGCFLLAASGPDREAWIRHELYFREQTPYAVGQSIGQILRTPHYEMPDHIACDSAMAAVSDGGETPLEGVQRGIRSVLYDQAPFVVPAPKGPGSRTAGKLLVHEGLRYKPDLVRENGTLAPYHMPRLRIHTSCTNLLRTLPKLPLDPKNSEDVDTDAEDHAYDAARYMLVSRQPEVQKEIHEKWSRDKARGFHRDGVPRRPEEPDFDVQHERELAMRDGKGFRTGVTWER